VGDIIKTFEDESFPADLFVIGSSLDNGIAFIETGALDGEKNMKPKNCLIDTYMEF